MYRCPRCTGRLDPLRVHGTPTWTCRGCGSRAMTMASLRRVVPRDLANLLWQRSRDAEAPAGRRCHSCGHPARQVDVLGASGGVTLDVCPRCHIVFFDPGEFESLPEKPEPPPEPPKPALTPDQARALVSFEIEHADTMAEATRRTGEGPLGGRATPPDQLWKYVPGLLGMPVELDTPNASSRVWLTWVVLAVLLAVGVLTVPDIQPVADGWGYVAANPLRHGGLTLVTYFFLHASWLHLLGNLYFLWIFGDDTEGALGPGAYLVLLVLATIAGCAVHSMLLPEEQTPMVGSSGGISGVLVFYALAFPRVRIGLLYFWVLWLRLPAIGYLAFWLVLQLVGASMGGDHVAYGGHLGGALAGFLWWLAWRFGGRRAGRTRAA